MTRKDFELIAETIRFSDIPVESIKIIAAEFADSLRRTNPRFDVDRFVAAATKPLRSHEVARDTQLDASQRRND